MAYNFHTGLAIAFYQLLLLPSVIMSIRLLCKQTPRQPSNALYYFQKENKTGIAPTRRIAEKTLDLTVGMLVTVNWDGKMVEAEILALNGKSGLVNLI